MRIRTDATVLALIVTAAGQALAEPARNSQNLEFERFTIPGTANAPAPAPTPPAEPSPTPAEPPAHVPHHDFHPHHHTHHGFDGRFGRRLGVYYGDAYYYRGPVTGVYSPIDPNLVVSPPRDRAAPPPTVEALTRAGRFDDALALIGARDPDAIGARDHLERALILALAGDLDQAAAAAEAALSADPDALFEPIDGPAFAGSRYTLRRAVVAAVRRAHRTGQARAWQLVASLMHAESRDRLAARMLERAASLGSAAPTAGPAGPG